MRERCNIFYALSPKKLENGHLGKDSWSKMVLYGAGWVPSEILKDFRRRHDDIFLYRLVSSKGTKTFHLKDCVTAELVSEGRIDEERLP